MKWILKLIISACILLVFSIKSYSQITVASQVGMNIAALNGHKNYDENYPRIGGAAFLLLDIPVVQNGFLSIETGVGISQMGMRHKVTTEDLAVSKTTEIKNVLDYAVMPLYVKENFGSVYTKFGVYGAYLINVQSKLSTVETKMGVVSDPISSKDKSFVENANPYDYGASFGFGFIKHLKSKRFRRKGGRRVLPILKVDFKYNVGIAEISTEKTPAMRLKNRVFMVGVTFSSVPNR